MAGRFRSVSNLAVPQQAYSSAVSHWLSLPPVMALRCKLGPSLSRDFRSVTPGMLEACLPLIEKLLHAGETSCVMQACKMEVALKTELSKNSILLGLDDCDKLAYEATNHIQNCFAMLRYLKLENDGASGSPSRPYPKSGGFRRRVPSTLWPALDELMEGMKVCRASKVPTSLDSQGFPTIFSQFLAQEQDAQLEVKRACSEETVVFDEEGFPVMTEPAHTVAEEPCKMALDDLIEPLPLSSKQRKKAILERRQASRTTRRSPAAVKLSRGSPDDNIPFQKLCLAISQKPKPRAELTGRIQLPDGSLKRMHVFTLTLASWGETFEKDAKHLKSTMEANNMTKAQAMELKAACAQHHEQSQLRGK